MDNKLFDSELRVMELVWEGEPISAKALSLLADERYGWNKNTTYTVIKKCEAKLFGGSRRALFSALLEDEELSEEELDELRAMIEKK